MSGKRGKNYLPDSIYVYWDDECEEWLAVHDYTRAVDDREVEERIVGEYHLVKRVIVEKHVSMSTRPVSKKNKIGRHP